MCIEFYKIVCTFFSIYFHIAFQMLFSIWPFILWSVIYRMRVILIPAHSLTIFLLLLFFHFFLFAVPVKIFTSRSVWCLTFMVTDVRLTILIYEHRLTWNIHHIFLHHSRIFYHQKKKKNQVRWQCSEIKTCGSVKTNNKTKPLNGQFALEEKIRKSQSMCM